MPTEVYLLALLVICAFCLNRKCSSMLLFVSVAAIVLIAWVDPAALLNRGFLDGKQEGATGSQITEYVTLHTPSKSVVRSLSCGDDSFEHKGIYIKPTGADQSIEVKTGGIHELSKPVVKRRPDVCKGGKYTHYTMTIPDSERGTQEIHLQVLAECTLGKDGSAGVRPCHTVKKTGPNTMRLHFSQHSVEEIHRRGYPAVILQYSPSLASSNVEDGM